MSATSRQTMPATNRFVRIVMIVVVGCAVGPLVAASVLWVERTLFELHQGTASPAAQWLAVWGGMLLVGYLFGVPYALLTSGIFALVAVLAGGRHLMAALVIALIPAFLFFAASVQVGPQWRGDAGFWAMGSSMIVIATTVCWYLSRRWHSPNA